MARDDEDTAETPMRDSSTPGEPPEIDRDALLIQVFERNTDTQAEMAEHQAAMADRMRSVDARGRRVERMVALAVVIFIAGTLWNKVDSAVVRELAIGAGAKLDANGSMIQEALLTQQAMNEAEIAEEEAEAVEILAAAEPARRRSIFRKIIPIVPEPEPPAVAEAKAQVVKKRRAARAQMDSFLKKHRVPEPAPESRSAEKK